MFTIPKEDLQHLVLTHFSARDFSMRSRIDPLEPRRLRHRFAVFEWSALPCLLGQTSSDFTWVLLVDPELPEADRSRLADMTGRHERTHLHSLLPGTDLLSLEWLEPYIRPGVRYVVTSNLDDDDLLFRDFVAYTSRQWTGAGIPPLGFQACQDVVQWDFLPTRRAPLGHVKPFTRHFDSRFKYPVSTGFSLGCKYPEVDLCVLGFRHTLGELYCRAAEDLPRLGRLRRVWAEGRAAIEAAARASRLDWQGELSVGGNYHDVRTDRPPAVVVNHMGNLQLGRLIEYPGLRRPVEGPASFPGVCVDFEKAAIHAREVRFPTGRRLAVTAKVLIDAWRSGPAGRPWRRRLGDVLHQLARLR